METGEVLGAAKPCDLSSLLLSLKRYNEAGSGMSEELWAGWAAGPQEAQLLWPEALLR